MDVPMTKRRVANLLLAAACVSLPAWSATAVPATAVAAPGAATPTSAPAAAPTAPALTTSLHGVAWFWGLNQHGFLLGKDATLDDADYVVHNIRLMGTVGTEHIGVVVRADVFEGWWGVDNDPDVATSVGVDDKGAPAGSTATNPYALFRNKGTGYPLHVDYGWLWFDLPGIPVKMQIGRQPFSAGNKLVLDQTVDGIRADVSAGPSIKATLSYAKMHEGVGSGRSPLGALMNDDDERADGNLFGLSLNWRSDPKAKHQVEVFGYHYRDGAKKTAYLPQGLIYGMSRFQAQISNATVAGAHAQGTLDVGKGLAYNVEIDVLRGEDNFDNADFAGNLLDKNDGTLKGYNAYLTLQQKLDAGIPVDVQLTLGMGSGDDDPSKGAGNINRIQTMGYFGLTNVWEDSVMPDVEGISPQGLGSPVSRGYRELENTTVGMLTVGANVLPSLRIEAAYAYLRSTAPVFGWTAAGPSTATSHDLGQEVDLNIKWAIRPGLQLIGLYGAFMPGDAAALLINGNTDSKEMAWEAKHVLQWAF